MTREQFVEKFLAVFAKSIDKRKRRKYRIGLEYGGYLWHIFYYKLLPSFVGDEARKEYDKVDKNGALEIQYDVNIGYNETFDLERTFLTAKGVDLYGYPEFYIIGKDFSWCYVVTHDEDLCGPYFCYAPEKNQF